MTIFIKFDPIIFMFDVVLTKYYRLGGHFKLLGIRDGMVWGEGVSLNLFIIHLFSFISIVSTLTIIFSEFIDQVVISNY